MDEPARLDDRHDVRLFGQLPARIDHGKVLRRLPTADEPRWQKIPAEAFQVVAIVVGHANPLLGRAARVPMLAVRGLGCGRRVERAVELGNHVAVEILVIPNSEQQTNHGVQDRSDSSDVREQVEHGVPKSLLDFQIKVYFKADLDDQVGVLLVGSRRNQLKFEDLVTGKLCELVEVEKFVLQLDFRLRDYVGLLLLH